MQQQPQSALRAGFLTELSVAGRKMRTLFDGLVRQQGLNLSRARLLLQLARNEAVTQSELAALLELEHPTIVRLLDGLEKQGLIRRSTMDGDRRAKQVSLMQAAEGQVAALDETVGAMRGLLLHDVTEEELEVASRVLRKLVRNIEAQSPSLRAGEAAPEEAR
ncbi:MarR family winged helix-turn-helix transcriptional regulator [Pseudoroseomonas ludipueritiae]|uniref:MarR family transcriptional regulator n=1 Tax=Pseudoroseomonas ludipueritiae TaxID=198093 RepID=A0ABR7RCH4_9PROT|nr:MarR family transcriptional regulator [Pseudoroseomonas ludipueritiae]MBC9179373.1 MarR family transcriptional regulator [Pseudoroseomonas ludipueritiae]